MTELKLEAENVSHPDCLARRPIDPAIREILSEAPPSRAPNITIERDSAEASPMDQDDDVGAPELRRRRGEGVGSHNCIKTRVRVTKLFVGPVTFEA